MSLCANPRCREQLADEVWPGGTCSRSCSAAVFGLSASALGANPNEDAGGIVARTQDLLDEWEAAAEFGPKMPSVVMLRAKGWALRRIAARIGERPNTVGRWLREWNAQRGKL